MIQEGDEYQIYFTRDNIRAAGATYRRIGTVPYGLYDAEFTDEQCDEIANEIERRFDEAFFDVIRNVEV